jgi:hypothetical protein
VDVVEWSRALDVRLSEWCCSVSMVWVQIPSREEQKIDSSKISVTCCRSLVFSGFFGFLRLHNKTDHHNIAEILLKVALNTINLNLTLIKCIT